MSVYDLLELKEGDEVRRLGATANWRVVTVGSFEVWVESRLAGGIKARIGPRDCGRWTVQVRPPRRTGARM